MYGSRTLMNTFRFSNNEKISVSYVNLIQQTNETIQGVPVRSSAGQCLVSLDVVIVHRLSWCVTVMEEQDYDPLEDSSLALPPL